MNDVLTEKDIISLSKNPTATAKAEAVKKITVYYNGKELTPRGRKLAEDIFRLMVHDVETKVREALSTSLKDSHNVPKDVISKIINDKENISIPFIKYYENLDNEDLINIIEAQNIEKQKAVAQRRNLNEDVSDYIANKCNEEVVVELVSNNTANIRETTYHSIVNKYAKSNNIKTGLVYRSMLPVSVIEKIVSSLSRELQTHLITHHDLPQNLATDIVDQVQERTTLRISEDYSSDRQVEQLVQQLHGSNRLTSSLVVRAICTGDLKFFEYAIAFLSKSTISEVRKILFNSNADFMIRNLLRRSFIPNNMFPAVLSAITVISDLRFDNSKSNRKIFSHKVIERVLSLESASGELHENDINYLISKIT